MTEDFLAYLKRLSDAQADLRLIADFISVASKLILIKSKVLLPEIDLTPEEEGGIKDLEVRLRLYQELKPLFGAIQKLWRGGARAWSRPFFLDRNFSPLVAGPAACYPGNNLESASLRGALEKMFDAAQSLMLETETIKGTIVTLEEKIEEVIRKLQGEGGSSFKHLSLAKPRGEVIIIFLAILHLAREERVHLEQVEHFSDIIIKQRPVIPA